MTDLAPPCASPAAAFFNVIARASRTHSSTLTSGAMRVPPIAGPRRRVVDHDDRLEAERGLMDVDDLLRTQLIGEAEHVLHGVRSPSLGRGSCSRLKACGLDRAR